LNPTSGANTQQVEALWGKAKHRKKAMGASRNMIDSYLCEFMWRQKNKNKDLFLENLTDIVAFWDSNK